MILCVPSQSWFTPVGSAEVSVASLFIHKSAPESRINGMVTSLEALTTAPHPSLPDPKEAQLPAAVVGTCPTNSHVGNLIPSAIAVGSGA